MDLISILAIAVLGFCAGYIYSHMQTIRELDKIIGAAKRPDDIEFPEPITLQHNIINGVNYFYTEGGKFVGQGATLDEAAAHYMGLNGNKTIALFKHSEFGLTYCFIDGVCRRCTVEKK
jgi:hypothetical protein